MIIGILSLPIVTISVLFFYLHQHKRDDVSIKFLNPTHSLSLLKVTGGLRMTSPSIRVT